MTRFPTIGDLGENASAEFKEIAYFLGKVIYEHESFDMVQLLTRLERYGDAMSDDSLVDILKLLRKEKRGLYGKVAFMPLIAHFLQRLGRRIPYVLNTAKYIATCTQFQAKEYIKQRSSMGTKYANERNNLIWTIKGYEPTFVDYQKKRGVYRHRKNNPTSRR